MYDKLVVKVNNIDTSAFIIKKTEYQTDIAEPEKNPDVTDFVKKLSLN